MAATIGYSELACAHLVRYVLGTHSNLADADIAFGVNYICSFYARGHDTPSALLTDDQLIKFLVYADQTGICQFALIANQTLDQALQNRNQTALQRLLLERAPEAIFPELYDNPFLENSERDFIIRLISREMFATKLLFEMVKSKIINMEPIDTQSFVDLELGPEGPSLPSKCYGEVCIKDAHILEDDPARAIMSQHEKVPLSVYTVDKAPSHATPQIFCFKTLELIKAVTDPVPINPKTGAPFSDYTIQLTNQRFHKEIALYRRYRQLRP